MTGFPRVCASALPILGLVFAVLTGSGRALAQTPAPAPTIRTAITAAPRDPAPTATTDPASIPVGDPTATLDPSVTPDPGATPAPGALSGEVVDPAAVRTVLGVEPGSDRTLALPAFTGEAGTAFSDEAMFQSLSPLRRAWFLREYHRMRGDTLSAPGESHSLGSGGLDVDAVRGNVQVAREVRFHCVKMWC